MWKFNTKWKKIKAEPAVRLTHPAHLVLLADLRGVTTVREKENFYSNHCARYDRGRRCYYALEALGLTPVKPL